MKPYRSFLIVSMVLWTAICATAQEQARKTIPLYGDTVLPGPNSPQLKDRGKRTLPIATDRVVFSPGGSLFAEFVNPPSGNGYLKVSSIATGKEYCRFTGHVGEIHAAVFAGNDLLLSSGEDKSIRLWNVPNRTLLRTIACGDAVTALAATTDKRTLAFGYRNNRIELYDAAANTIRQVLVDPPPGSIQSLAFTPDGRYLISGSTVGKAILWDVAGGERIRDVLVSEKPITAVACSPDGKLVAAGSENGRIDVWSLSAGRTIYHLKASEYAVASLAFSPDSQRLVRGVIGGMVAFEDVNTGELKRLLKGHWDLVKSVAFLPNNGGFAFSGPKILHIWAVK